MHDIKWIRDNPDAFKAALKRRGIDYDVSKLLEVDKQLRETVGQLQETQERRNALSKEVGEAKKARDEVRATKLMQKVASFKEAMSMLEYDETVARVELEDLLAEIPNLPTPDVPDGKDADDNKLYRDFGTNPRDDKDHPLNKFKPKLHFEIGEALGLMDFEAASKISGARFVVLKGALARLERALSQLFLDVHTDENGYTEVSPPILVGADAMFGTAQLPKFEDDQFLATRSPEVTAQRRKVIGEINKRIEENLSKSSEHQDVLDEGAEGKEAIDAILGKVESGWRNRRELKLLDLNLESHWLIPTAEVSLTNLVREDITDEAKLPMRLTACTPCFRAEAGAAGKDTRGMIRQHQFIKVELVSITTPEQSAEEHERMLKSAEKVLQKLGLHYRVMTLCTGDMGFASQKTYDIEVWLPGENAYREISSCSNCGDFQARRMNARYRAKDAKSPRYVHTLNGSGVAVGRALIAVLENYQDKDGNVTIPDALLPYMGGLTKITKAN